MNKKSCSAFKKAAEDDKASQPEADSLKLRQLMALNTKEKFCLILGKSFCNIPYFSRRYEYDSMSEG